MNDSSERETLERRFYKEIPKARKINPTFRAFFDFMYAAHQRATSGSRVLNIYSSRDFSGNREELYRDGFFKDTVYYGLDFWQDRFLPPGKAVPSDAERHTIPYPDRSFDVLVTTKYIMEHISEPETVVREMHRVLVDGGEAFVTVAHIRRQHQVPYDYYRFTEFALEHLFTKVGFRDIVIRPTNGAMTSFAMYAYFFERQTPMPAWLARTFDWVHYSIIEPVFFWLDRFDNGYGRDFSLYFLVRAKR